MQRVLIVDDDPDIQRLVSYNLGQAGFEVNVAASGRKASLKPAISCSWSADMLGMFMALLPAAHSSMSRSGQSAAQCIACARNGGATRAASRRG